MPSGGSAGVASTGGETIHGNDPGANSATSSADVGVPLTVGVVPDSTAMSRAASSSIRPAATRSPVNGGNVPRHGVELLQSGGPTPGGAP